MKPSFECLGGWMCVCEFKGVKGDGDWPKERRDCSKVRIDRTRRGDKNTNQGRRFNHRQSKLQRELNVELGTGET